MNFIKYESEQKLRGGYYTPLDLATYISKWVMEHHPQRILEPSCGDGVFVDALTKIGFPQGTKFTGFELLPSEARKVQEKCNHAPELIADIHARDFLGWAIRRMSQPDAAFDAVIGNPPFIRYQYLSEEAQANAEKIFRLLSLPFTKHTNAWVPFVLASISLLSPHGRLGMIVPSEIIHVAHAQSLRTYLGETCSRLLIIDPEELWFDGTLQGAVILLAEKKEAASDHSDGLGIMKVSGRRFIEESSSQHFESIARINGKTVEGKWTRALLSSQERTLLEALGDHKETFRFDAIAEVDVGIVTGANNFFLVNDDVVKKYGLEKYAHPMFGRSAHCRGVIYDKHQHAENAKQGNPTNFIWLNEDLDTMSETVAEYVRLGEAQSLHTRYKCRIRRPWYTVPSVYATKVGMLKRAHDTPRLIYNRLEAYTTDTAYRITANACAPEKLVYCFANSLTALSAELEGRHYGGGVLELVPSEIERLLIPLPDKLRPEVRQLDNLVREADAQTVLEVQDKKVLGPLGLTNNEQAQLVEAWLRLKNRRQRIAEIEI
ncbi:Eco57I restriction-modification methylase domain-containing protein [Burkholderia vietnamiensis]|uniref:Eco57I restriction-modification methylase domain-containing protein n=1 Tax=Burkholderia vietnamiensis TaxID=60552 RepID=UPI001CF4E294|nr:class I SAM-dependent methyltransferase [Burkholderia vietnamiensis]MCA8450531.1 class I SAM-dependent methyltransferase [Burkholderia vietnamiensis]HDR8952685.1 class I SAM-dependent methyltransferase [Burkholderia vietnamiensis]